MFNVTLCYTFLRTYIYNYIYFFTLFGLWKYSRNNDQHVPYCYLTNWELTKFPMDGKFQNLPGLNTIKWATYKCKFREVSTELMNDIQSSEDLVPDLPKLPLKHYCSLSLQYAAGLPSRLSHFTYSWILPSLRSYFNCRPTNGWE